MCKFFDGEICENEICDNFGKYCNNPSDCEYIESDSISFDDIIDNADDEEIEFIESCHGDLEKYLDNL